MVRCPNCGFENEDLAVFCKECLKRLPVLPLRNPSTPRVKPPLESENSMRLFVPTPSGALPMRLIETESGVEIDVPIGIEYVVIGREDPENDFFPEIDTTTIGGNIYGISRRHAQIILKGNQYFVQDLNSMNSTFVNKIKVAGNQLFPLNDDDLLTLGKLEFKVCLITESDRSAAQASSSQA
ncbi:FHA domain-containing protein [bacterium]|nr:FHA domain-containing protein [bacterium]